MSAPRVLFVCHGHPALVPGGTEWLAHDLFRALRDDAATHALFVGCVSPLHRADRVATRLQAIGRAGDELLLWVGGFDRFGLNQTEPQATARHLRDILGQFRPQIVHFHHFSRIGLEALLAVRQALPAAKIVVTLHDFHLICANDGLMLTTDGRVCHAASLDACRRCLPQLSADRLAARGLAVRNLLKLVDHFIAPSRFCRDRHVAWGLPRARISVIANAVADGGGTGPAAPAPVRARRVFGFFGNIAPHKGVLTLLAAMREVGAAGSDAALVIHGGMNFQPQTFRTAFAAALAAAEPWAWHAGAYDRHELGRLMAGVDWVVVPSIWWENAPLVILEAFGHRRPVICADLGGMAEMVADGVNGLHFQAGNPHALARVMRRALTEPGLWERLVAGLPVVPTLAEAVAAHRALYEALVAGAEASAA